MNQSEHHAAFPRKRPIEWCSGRLPINLTKSNCYCTATRFVSLVLVSVSLPAASQCKIFYCMLFFANLSCRTRYLSFVSVFLHQKICLFLILNSMLCQWRVSMHLSGRRVSFLMKTRSHVTRLTYPINHTTEPYCRSLYLF